MRVIFRALYIAIVLHVHRLFGGRLRHYGVRDPIVPTVMAGSLYEQRWHTKYDVLLWIAYKRPRETMPNGALL